MELPVWCCFAQNLLNSIYGGSLQQSGVLLPVLYPLIAEYVGFRDLDIDSAEKEKALMIEPSFELSSADELVDEIRSSIDEVTEGWAKEILFDWEGVHVLWTKQTKQTAETYGNVTTIAYL